VGKLRRDQRSTNAPLNLSCSPSFATLWLTPRVSDLLQGKSGVTVRIYGEYHMLDRVGMGLSGIQAGIRFDPGHYVDLNEEMFLDEWIIPVTTPEFLARHPDIRSIADVAPGMMLHDENPWHSATQNVEWNTWLEAMDAPPSKPGGCTSTSRSWPWWRRSRDKVSPWAVWPWCMTNSRAGGSWRPSPVP
jgi:DNA-binding transcriptional LysR family regulator